MIKTIFIRRLSAFCALFLLVISGLFVSCLFDVPGNSDNLKTGITLRFRASIPPTRSDVTTGTTEDGYEKENSINKVDIFFYDGENLVWHPTNIILTENNSKAQIVVDKTHEPKFQGNVNYSIYVVINFPGDLSAENSISLSNLKKKVLTATFNTSAPIVDFVMTGAIINKNINLSNTPLYDAGTIDLKRVAAKVRAQFPIIPSQIEEYVPGGTKKYELNATVEQPVMVRLVNYHDKSYLDEPRNYYAQSGALVKVSQFRAITRTSTPDGYTTLVPFFYSYENEWLLENSANRTFLEYKVPLKDITEGTTKYYFYSVGISGKQASNPNGFNKAERNHLYDVTPHIGRIGGTSPEEVVEVNGYYRIADWTTNAVNVEILDAHYFVAKEHNVILANTNTYSVPFEATRVVSLKSIGEVYFTRYDPNDGTSSKVIIPAGDTRYPSFSISNTAPKKITVTSEIPNNYAPKYFSATFIDAGGLEETIHFVQYPEKYITGRVSDAADLISGVDYTTDANQTNYNLFTVTTLTGSGLKIGDPSYREADGKVYTKTDEESNKLVSPKFVIASQRGIYDRVFYDDSFTAPNGRRILSARERCANYGEGGYPVGTWRLPTRAEIKYIDMLQDQGSLYPDQSSVRRLLAGDAYWSAQPYKFYNFTTVTTPDNVTTESGWNTGGVTRSDWSYYNSYYISYSSPGYTGFYGNEYGFPWLVEYGNGSDVYAYYATRYISAYVRCVHDVY